MKHTAIRPQSRARTQLPGPKHAAASTQEELPASELRALRMRVGGVLCRSISSEARRPNSSGTVEVRLLCTRRSSDGEAEPRYAAVPLQGALQGPDSGEPVGSPG